MFQHSIVDILSDMCYHDAGSCVCNSGCPIYMPDEVVFANLHSMSNGEKDVLCTCLFHALNWFIEVSIQLLAVL